MNDKQRKAFEEFYETDFSFEIPSWRAFASNAFNQKSRCRSGIPQYSVPHPVIDELTRQDF